MAIQGEPAQQSIEFARRVLRPILSLAPTTFLEDTSRALNEWGIHQAVAEHNTAAIFDWVVPLLAFQGIGDAAAASFAARNDPVTLQNVEQGVQSGACPRLRSYWHYADCRYRKETASCAEDAYFAGCFVPRLPSRKGTLSQAATSLHLFIRDVCANDLVGWIDVRLASVKAGRSGPARDRALRGSVLEPLCNVVGVGPKLWSMILADLLLAGDPGRKLWVRTGAAMTSIDSLVHNFLHRTGILSRLAAGHPYGPGCYAAGGCSDIISAVAREIDAREFNASFPSCFPRFVEKAIWHFCAEGGRNICNGRQIDDRYSCRNAFCPTSPHCARLLLHSV